MEKQGFYYTRNFRREAAAPAIYFAEFKFSHAIFTFAFSIYRYRKKEFYAASRRGMRIIIYVAHQLWKADIWSVREYQYEK